MKLFLDDERPIPNTSWHLAKTADDAIAFLDANGPSLTHISLDHDLGREKSGYDVACHLEQMHHEGRLNPDVELTIHSANPAGAERIGKALEQITGRRWTTFLVDYIRLCRWENEGY